MLLLTRMRDTALARSLLWRWSARGVWPVAFALSLLGTELLRRESLRIWALLLLVGAAVMAVCSGNTGWLSRLSTRQLQCRSEHGWNLRAFACAEERDG